MLEQSLPQSLSKERDPQRGIERRRNPQITDAPLDALQALPTLLVLQRLPVPVLAVGDDGNIVFANQHFAAMIGQPRDVVLATPLAEILHWLPADEAAASIVRERDGAIVELTHAEGWTVHARMSKSILMRDDDPMVLVIFEDCTEQQWLHSRDGGLER